MHLDSSTCSKCMLLFTYTLPPTPSPLSSSPYPHPCRITCRLHWCYPPSCAAFCVIDHQIRIVVVSQAWCFLSTKLHFPLFLQSPCNHAPLTTHTEKHRHNHSSLSNSSSNFLLRDLFVFWLQRRCRTVQNRLFFKHHRPMLVLNCTTFWLGSFRLDSRTCQAVMPIRKPSQFNARIYVMNALHLSEVFGDL